MTAPRVQSDNVAIDAAHQRRMENARNALDAAVAAFHLRPAPRWHLEALIRAAGALRDEAIAGLERAYGRQDGGFRGEGYERPQSPAEAPPAADDDAKLPSGTPIPTGGNFDHTQAGYPGITHTASSPLRTLGGSMHDRTEARLAASDAKVCASHTSLARRDIEHTSPTGRLGDSDAERFARAEAMFSGARMGRNRSPTVMLAGPSETRRPTAYLDGHGPAAPTNPEDDGA